MTITDRCLGLAGFDAALLARLGSVRVRLLVLAVLSLMSSASIGASAGYACWLIGGELTAALVVGLGFGAGALNLLRVAAAGGGIAPHLEREQALRWRPPWLPAVVMALLALCFAQPALLALYAARLEPQIEHYRAERSRAQAELHGAPGSATRAASEAEPQAAFRAALAGEAFAVQRILLVWRDRPAAVRASLGFTLLCLLPLLASRWPLGHALHAYEIERYRRARRFVAAHHAATDRAVQRQLERWPARPTPLPAGPAQLIDAAQLWRVARGSGMGGGES